MRLVIQRGCAEIGGTSIELSHADSVLLLDVGLPLGRSSSQLDPASLRATVGDLEARGVSVRFVRSSYSGYGLFDEDQFLGMDAFKRVVDEDLKKARRSRQVSPR